MKKGTRDEEWNASHALLTKLLTICFYHCFTKKQTQRDGETPEWAVEARWERKDGGGNCMCLKVNVRAPAGGANA